MGLSSCSGTARWRRSRRRGRVADTVGGRVRLRPRRVPPAVGGRDGQCRDLPGYKHYTDSSGYRPAVFVCFLDVVADPRGSVNGLCVPVDAAR